MQKMGSFADYEVRSQLRSNKSDTQQSGSKHSGSGAHNSSMIGSLGFNSFKVSTKNRLRNILNIPSQRGNTHETITAQPAQGYMKLSAPQSNTISIRVSDTSPQETVDGVLRISRDNTPRRVQPYIHNLNEPEIIKAVSQRNNTFHDSNELDEHSKGSTKNSQHANYASIIPSILVEDSRCA